jgi:peptidyl-prolyl cis-trans isomerase D
MDAFRTLIRGWLGKVLLVLFLAPLVFVGLESYFASSTKADVAVKVNGQDISQAELDNWNKLETDEYLRSVNGDSSLLNKAVIEAQVYDAAVVRALLLQQAEKLGIKLNAEQLGTLIRQQAAFQDNGQFSEQRFQQYLQQNRSNVERLLSDFGQRLSLSLLTNSIQFSTLYSAQQGQQLLAMLGQERSTHIAQLALDQYAQNFVATEAQAQAYYAAHRTDFMRTANADVQYVVLPKAQFAQQVQVTDQEINQQYQIFTADQNKQAGRQISQILVSTEKRSADQALKIAQDLEVKLKSGVPFTQLVQQYSDDLVTKAAQGKVEGYTLGAFGDAFDQAVLALQQGQNSAPVKTQYGYHLIHIDHVDAAQVPALAQVHDQLVNVIKLKKATDAFQDAVAAANEIAVQSDAADAIADQYKLTVQTVPAVTHGQTHNAILADPAVKQRIFSKEVIDGDRNLSTVINLKNGDAAWVKVLNYRAEGVKSFAEAKAEVLVALKRQAQIQQAKAAMAPLLAKLNSQPAAQALLGSTVKFQDIGAVPRYSQLLPAALERAVFSLAAPKAGHWTVTAVDFGQSLYLIGISQVGQNPDMKLNDQQQQQVIARFDPRGQLELNDYIEYLKSTAKIEKIASN